MAGSDRRPDMTAVAVAQSDRSRHQRTRDHPFLSLIRNPGCESGPTQFSSTLTDMVLRTMQPASRNTIQQRPLIWPLTIGDCLRTVDCIHFLLLIPSVGNTSEGVPTTNLPDRLPGKVVTFVTSRLWMDDEQAAVNSAPAMFSRWQALSNTGASVMRSRLANHFRSVRKERDLSLSQLARLVGYTNVTKGSNKIQKFEQRGEIHTDLLWKLADELDIDKTTIDTLVEQDRREFVRVWNEWANEPIRPHIVIRLIPAVYKRSELPDGIVSVEEAEIIAADVARRWRKKVCLQWTRRLSVWFDSDGNVEFRTETTPGEINAPYMRLGNGRRSFVLENPATGGTVLHLIDWPKQPMVTPSVSSTSSERK